MYIVGPITGVPEYHENFANAQMVLEHLGYTVLNPAWLPPGMEYEQYMSIDAAMLAEADTICLLPGWMKSAGALREHNAAKAERKRIIYYDRIRIND